MEVGNHVAWRSSALPELGPSSRREWECALASGLAAWRPLALGPCYEKALELPLTQCPAAPQGGWKVERGCWNLERGWA